MGVGADIAAGNQVENGYCDLFVIQNNINIKFINLKIKILFKK